MTITNLLIIVILSKYEFYNFDLDRLKVLIVDDIFLKNLSHRYYYQRIRYLMDEKLPSSYIYIYIVKNYLCLTKPFADNNFCLNDCRFGGKFD